MKLLLDECVAYDLKRDLVGHEVATVVEAGFGGLENGELLRAASGKFDVLITVDRNLPFQQYSFFSDRGIDPDGCRYHLCGVEPLIPEVLIRLGEILRVGSTQTVGE